MAIEKSLYEAPEGIGALAEEEAPLEIEIVDPEEVNINLPDGMQLHLEKATAEFDTNLAEYMDEGELMTLASDLLSDFDSDVMARKDWLDTYVKGLQLLGLKYEDRTEPWQGACGVHHPLLMESAVKFQSETIMETFPAGGPVRTKIIGKETAEKKEAAARVEEDMNYQLTEVMREYRPEHERLLISLCLAGNAFKKIYFDPAMERQTAVFVPAEDIIVPYGAQSLESSERITHRMRKTQNELRRLQVAGFYRDIDLGEPMRIMDEVEKEKAREQGFQASMDERFQILEMHVDIDLPGYEDVDKDNNETGIALPYIVTIEKGTGTILAIRRNWLEDDKLKKRRQHFTHYGYIPGFGFYYFGLIHLIGGHTKSATSLLRQLIDAGTLANLPGGLKARGLRIKGDDTPIAPGEFRDVDLPSGAIRDNILPLPYKEPSQTLLALLDKVIDEGRRFAGVADLKVADMSAQAPVGTTLAILERALKVMSAVQARVHYTMKQEFKLLAAIIRDNAPQEYDYDPDSGDRSAKQSDYDMVEVIPVSDPNATTMSQRVVQYQAVIQLAQSAPQIYDLPFLHRQMLEVLGVKNAAKIIPLPDDMKPVDPVAENMNVLTGKPLQAFMTQDHDAHLAVHTAMLQDPKMAAQVNQNPQGQAIVAALHAHIMEHMAFKYRADLEAMLGAPLPPPPAEDDPEPMTPHLEAQVSQLAAQAAAKLLQKNTAEMQMQQAQQQAQDPLFQLQQQEMQIKAQEVQRKAQKDQIDAQMKAQQNALAQQKAQMEAQKAQMDAQIRMQEIQQRGNEAAERLELEGAKLGIEVQKNQQNSRDQRLNSVLQRTQQSAKSSQPPTTKKE